MSCFFERLIDDGGCTDSCIEVLITGAIKEDYGHLKKKKAERKNYLCDLLHLRWLTNSISTFTAT